MHKAGVVFIWLAVVLALGAIYLTERVYYVRNSWAAEVEKLSQANRKQAEDIQQKQTTLRTLQRQYDAEMRTWGPYWFPVQAGVAPDGTITLGNLGSDLGLGRTGAAAAGAGAGGQQGAAEPAAGAGGDSKPTVFLFATQQDGTGAQFIGGFHIAQLARTTATLIPTWLVNPQEPPTWKGNAWRVRTNIPSGDKDRVRSLRADLITAFNYYNDKQRHLKVQQEAVAQAQKLHEARKAELQGDPMQAELRGLIAEIEQTEEERNKEQAELDRLRREVHRVYTERENLVQQLQARDQQAAAK